ncbi:hypothetical protein [Streptomyces sp. NPDC054901]
MAEPVQHTGRGVTERPLHAIDAARSVGSAQCASTTLRDRLRLARPAGRYAKAG